MSNTKDAARSSIEEIKTSIRAVSTCTASTAAELQNLLLGALDEALQKENVRARCAKPLSNQSSSRRKGTTAINAATATGTKQAATLLTPRQKYILATEVANSTLKSLSDALKTRPAQPPTNTPKAADETLQPASTRHIHKRNPVHSPNPLQERSASQATNSPAKPSSLSRSTGYTSNQTSGLDPGLAATAECARIAFSYLRTPESIKIAGKDSPALQLENGLLAFIGKLVAHRLDSLAIKELRILKRRLDSYLNGNHATPKPGAIESQSLASLLDFGDVNVESPAISLIITHQTYTLREIARMRRPRLVQEAWDVLKLSHPSSPANLIYHQAATRASDTKSIRQLESLSQTILSLCPGVSSSDDPSPRQETLETPPHVILSLQHLAFKVRQRWWSLAKHQANVEKELLEPFSRCLTAFGRRANLSPAKNFEVAELLYNDLVEPGHNLTSINREKFPSTASAGKCLSSLAQAAGLTEAAMRWLEVAEEPEVPGSATRSAISLVRKATLTFDAIMKGTASPNLDETVDAALGRLLENLSGASADFDSLFIEVNSLRRVASRSISLQLQGQNGGANLPSLYVQAGRIISASIGFIRRYLGTKPSEDGQSRAHKRYEQRCMAMVKNMKSIIDSASVISKSPVRQDAESHWAMVDSLLVDCAAILQSIQESASSETSDFVELQNPVVRLSNAYWAVHLQLKVADPSSAISIAAMQRSCELLKARPLAERQSGMLVMKLERLGEALDSNEKWENSRDAYFSCIHCLIDFGAIDEGVQAAANLPVSRVFGSEGAITDLGRVLKSYHRSVLRSGYRILPEQAFFDNTGLPDAGRGLLLEWQFSLYQKSLARNRSWDFDVIKTIQAIVDRLLELYLPGEFPIRRRRAQLAFLQLAQEHPNTLPSTTLQIQMEPKDERNLRQSQDEGLLRYSTHLQAHCTLKTAMQEHVPSIVAIQNCLSTWLTLLGSSASWQEVAEKVYDTELWIADLQTLADCLAAKGEEYVSMQALQLLVKVLEMQKNANPSRLIAVSCNLALQLLRLGYTEKAGEIFEKVENLLLAKCTSTEAKLHWLLGFAEFLVEVKNTAKWYGCSNRRINQRLTLKSEEILTAAGSLAKHDAQFMDLTKPSTSLSGRILFNTVVADACYVHSLFCTAVGRYRDAARYAKQCVVLNRRVWAALESKSSSRKAMGSKDTDAEDKKSAKEEFNPLSSMRNEKGALLVTSTTHASLDDPDFWPLVPRLYRAMMQQSQVLADHGLLQEAVYMAEQAGKVASSTGSLSLIGHTQSKLAKYWAEASKLDKAGAALAQVDQEAPLLHLSLFNLYSSQAKIYHAQGNYEDELEIYGKAEVLVQELSRLSLITEMEDMDFKIDKLSERMSKTSLQESQARPRTTTQATKGRHPVRKIQAAPTARKTTKASNKTLQVKDTSKDRPTANNPPLSKLRTRVKLLKALAFLEQENVSAALKLMQQAQGLEQDQSMNILQLWVSYKTYLAQSMEGMTSDFTFNTLPESTIAFPAVVDTQRTSSDVVAPKRGQATTKGTARVTKGKKPRKQDFIETLQEVRKCVVDLHQTCALVGSNSEFNKASLALGSITVMMSVLSHGDSHDSMHPLYAAFINEMPKNKALQLQQGFIEVEQENISREDCLKWPELGPLEQSSSTSVSSFQKDLIDIIPESWTIVALGLNEGRDELYVTRYEAGHSPFILRLPMRRHASRDMDEENFSFDECKRDFEEIIELSDFSTRSAKDMTSREARLQWWNEREALDAKLHELLLNMENLWLGGFKGIFSQHLHQPSLLARFRKSFETILDRYMPSRRAKTQQAKPVLEARVLELFIGLGDPTKENGDLDEALLDLLYFVVDILQFNGEHNAYDEIDFDTIVIETTDALRDYYSALQSAAPSTPRHMILIPDNDLHAFPWESMPCLQPLAVSRLPSLAALRERILSARPPKNTKNAQSGHYISSYAGGTSILNPSGDLKHTLKTLKPRLDDLQGSWTHVTNRAPLEAEFETALREDELVLYFGHGSGAQFVRSKAVRRLYNSTAGTGTEKSTRKGSPGCATTFLFGCSSVHLTENGDFEPSGMLASYLVAGAPAVVGMLWDVTDKDCDRFAVKAGEVWGLWSEIDDEDNMPKSSKAPAKKAKGKGKVAQMVDEVETARAGPASGTTRKARGKHDTVGKGNVHGGLSQGEGRRRGVGLDEAVRKAREACVLRYLNGAAAVVYGIPCFLE